MSFDSLLVHELVVERTSSSADDEYGQATSTYATLAEVRGLIQPKSARELAELSQAGPVIATHTVYLRPTDVRAADRIRFEPDDGQRYELTSVRDAAGMGHHLECDARTVGAAG